MSDNKSKQINLIGISGKIGSGKDTVGKIIQDLTKPIGTGKREDGILISEWQIKKFAYALKEMTSKATGIPIEDLENEDVKNSYLGNEWSYIREERFVEGGVTVRKPVRYYLTPRQILQKLGTEVGRQVHANFWVNALFSEYSKESKWIITDVRFPNEAEAIEEKGGIVIRINRTKIQNGDKVSHQNQSHPQNQHMSEIALDNWKFDHVIENNGTIEDLKLKVEKILKQYGII